MNCNYLALISQIYNDFKRNLSEILIFTHILSNIGQELKYHYMRYNLNLGIKVSDTDLQLLNVNPDLSPEPNQFKKNLYRDLKVIKSFDNLLRFIFQLIFYKISISVETRKRN